MRNKGNVEREDTGPFVAGVAETSSDMAKHSHYMSNYNFLHGCHSSVVALHIFFVVVVVVSIHRIPARCAGVNLHRHKFKFKMTE